MSKEQEALSAPKCFNFKPDGDHLTGYFKISPKEFKKDNFRKFDPWTLVYASDKNRVASAVTFQIETNDGILKLPKFNIYMESFKRRVSFIAINNSNILFNVNVNSEQIQLYERNDLFNRSKDEIIGTRPGQRNDEDVPGRLEKDFQAWLFGKGLHKMQSDRTSERFAVLGEDFYNIKDIRMFREYPTGAFATEVKESSRRLSTDYIDMVTQNKYGKLSIIELKLNAPKLDAISQLLDYALYFRCYRSQLRDHIEEHIGRSRKEGIVCYIANNHFHPRLNDIQDFYTTKNKEYGFELKTINLGKTDTI